MKIYKEKSSGYDSVKSGAIAYDIQVLAAVINELVNVDGTPDKRAIQKQVLSSKNRVQLKAIGAELKTIEKRLRFILHGQY